MGVAYLCGISPTEFWAMTPAEFVVCAERHKAREEERTNDILTHAWLVAAYTRAKRLPDLKTIRQNERHEMTDEEMLEKIKLLNAAFGGDVNG